MTFWSSVDEEIQLVGLNRGEMVSLSHTFFGPKHLDIFVKKLMMDRF